MPNLPTRDELEQAFHPREYLERYFSETNEENAFQIEFMLSTMRHMAPNLRALEFGGGPTLLSVATLALQAQTIDFCDFIEGNLEEVRHWLAGEGNVFDWGPTVDQVLAIAHRANGASGRAAHEAHMRAATRGVFRCDARAAQPLGDAFEAPYDLVAAHHSTDVAATTAAEWFQVLRNVTTLVAPGGWLLISITTGSVINHVGDATFACANLTEDDVRTGYQQAGYDMGTFVLESRPFDTDPEEYSGVTMAVARRPVA